MQLNINELFNLFGDHIINNSTSSVIMQIKPVAQDAKDNSVAYKNKT
jgi:hypothetical protein